MDWLSEKIGAFLSFVGELLSPDGSIGDAFHFVGGLWHYPILFWLWSINATNLDGVSYHILRWMAGIVTFLVAVALGSWLLWVYLF